MDRRIIKYSNRRLYDATQGRSITLLELSDLVAAGETITVELKGTGEDITAITLLQSILEHLRHRADRALESGVADRFVSSVRRAIDERRGSDERDASVAGSDAAVALPD